MSGPVVSSDHANPQLHASSLDSGGFCPPLISADEIAANNSSDPSASMYCVIDGYVVEAVEFLRGKVHPGGKKKVQQTNDAGIGATSKPFTFSFSKGKVRREGLGKGMVKV